ncbi:MAG TPA: glycosyltransferase family 2 protein [Bacillota bacterium]|nr:MAG: putative glycosyltransferase CsbB [Firmicutes bacterium ADurb.Bin153]HNV35050.1 glycosyltransferase family 2 protein [Bacillota bacterium]
MKVCAIVPAYNEGPRVAAVTSVLKKCSKIDQILVINDGSTDNTAEAAGATGVEVLSLPHNMGKGAAVARGISATYSDVILLMDADLVGLTEKHVDDLLDPVINGDADMTVGIFRFGRVFTDLAQMMTTFLSGQRAIKRSLIEPSELESTEYGLETIITQIANEKSLKVKKVYLDDLTQVVKEEKLGLAEGSKLRAKMYWHVIKQVFKRLFRLK